VKGKLRLPIATAIKGKVAVLSTCGWGNFHHWNYDIIPRIKLLKEAGVFDCIDYFLINHSSQSFQSEAIRLMGIAPEKIINQNGNGPSLIQATILYVPSLPSALGTVSPWVVDFLRTLYNPKQERHSEYKHLYLSRKKVSTRKIVNNDPFMELLKTFSIVEVFPEDYSVSELARLLAGASFIISVHGSGLSNLSFISDNTTVVDILAPYHQDGYYWMISNIRNSKYIGFFGEGKHPADNIDLVAEKVDDDIVLDLVKMKELLTSKLR
jgi:capsular polysaccharide biosynthesis protein